MRMAYYHSLTDVGHLSSRLADPEVVSDVYEARKILTRVIEAGNAGRNVENLFPQVVKYLASGDLIIKKQACWFVTMCGQQSDMILLAINTLVKDCSDSNPMIRGLALKTLCSLLQISVADYCIQPTLSALKDPSAYVRRVAVMACIRINRFSADLVHDYLIVDKLYGMIRDPDPLVVANCLSALEEILHEEGGVVINRNIAHHLLNKLDTFTDWGVTLIFNLLQKYTPKTEDETLHIMNIVDNYFKSNNNAVVIGNIQYFNHLIQNMPHLKKQVLQKASIPMLQALASGNGELTYVLLNYIDELLIDNADIFHSHFRSLFCNYNEPLYVKIKKLDILPRITTEENIHEILEELCIYCIDITPDVTQSAIAAIGIVGNTVSECFTKCTRKLLDLLRLQLESVTSSTLQVLQQMDLRKCGSSDLQAIISEVAKSPSVVNDDSSKCATLWLLGEYGGKIDETPYILEDLINSMDDHSFAVDVQLSLLTATVKLFLERPAECQEMLGRLFERCSEGQNVDVHDRVVFYYQLLKGDIINTENILFHKNTKK